jgi:hypothetical protein
MIDIITNKELYLFDSVDRVFQSLEYAKSLPIPDWKEETIFHFYWRVPKEFGRKQALPLKSAIVTQDLSKTKIILWSNVDLSDNPYVKPLLPFIELKIWNLEQEVKNTPLENSKVVKGVVDDPLCYLGGDLFRLLCLYKYGGVYIDMDVVVLRDFLPILPYEFMYQWGSSGTVPTGGEPILKQNGAIMRLKQKSTLALDLLKELELTPAKPNTTCWGTELYHKVWNKNKNWITFPCAWFNTEWGMSRTIQPFKKNFEGNESSELFDGAFTWHWHNKWDEPIEDGCKFQILENLVEDKFKNLKDKNEIK